MSKHTGDDALRVPRRPRASTRSALAPLRVLSLTGGGYRGLFTAQLLVELCERAGRPGPLDGTFDVFAGTSIGGLMAAALALGIAPRRVLDAIDAHGAAVFPPKRQRTLRRALFGTLYDAGHLAAAIDDCLGKRGADTRLTDLDQGLIVPAVDWVGGRTVVFVSAFLGKAHASDATLRDVCLATAAAPTYFAPHTVDGLPMLDGGLAANNPDALAILEIARRWPARLARLQMLSLGTAGAQGVRRAAEADRPGVSWAANLADFMITVQEASATMQAERLLGNRYLRIDHRPPAGEAALFERLDAVSDATRAALLDAGRATAREAYRRHRAFIDRMLAQRPAGT